MPYQWTVVFIPAIAFFVNTIAQVVSFRYIKILGLLKTEYTGFAVGFIITFLYGLYLFFNGISLVDSLSLLISNITIYSALGYCYFHFLNLGETARRIRILRELYDSKTGLSMEELLSRYNSSEILERRIERLIDSGQILLKENRYYIAKPVILVAAKITVMMRLILLGKRSEFD